MNILKNKVVRKPIILILFIVFAVSGKAQIYEKSDNVREVSEFYKKYFEDQRRSAYFDRFVSLADTANFKFWLPIFSLKETSLFHPNYQRLSPYIDKEETRDNQIVFITNSKGVFCFFVINKKSYSLIMNDLPRHSSVIMSGDLVLGLTGINPNFGINNFPYADKKIEYKQIKEYESMYPDTRLFIIEGLPGIWGIRKHKLVKLMFKGDKVKELDGEEYYRNYLFPLSPNGIKRVIKGASFFEKPRKSKVKYLLM